MGSDLVNRLLAGTLVLLLSSCHGEAPQEEERPQPAVQPAMAFDASLSRSLTRAGVTGMQDLDALKRSEGEGGGFGVFCTYPRGEAYAGVTPPNFLYNQGVFWNGVEWAYTPLRYWPGEAGGTTERLTFFAYAPYVATDSAGNGKLAAGETPTDSGILYMSANTDNGGPRLRYSVGREPSLGVDLCWGVDPDTGLPLKDLTRPSAVGERVQINFRHATTRLQMSLDARDVDTGDSPDRDYSRIWVRRVEISGLALEGRLNLDNSTANLPRWEGKDGGLLPSEAEVFQDGRADGREGASANPKETPVVLNGAIIQDSPYVLDGEGKISAPAGGLSATPLNLFRDASSDAPLYVIPNGQPVNVRIDYDLETVSPNLYAYLSDGVTHGTAVHRSVKQLLRSGDTPLTLQAGFSYVIAMHVTERGVVFSASIKDWEAVNTYLDFVIKSWEDGDDASLDDTSYGDFED